MSSFIQIHDLKFKKFIDESVILKRVAEIGAEISIKHAEEPPILLGVLNGAFIFSADLARACEIDIETSFIKLASYEGATSTGEISTLIGLNADLDNRSVIIVEDIIDSGLTMHKFLPVLQKLGPKSIEIATLLVKREAMQFDLKIDYVGFEISNEFVVGYGLDYNQLGRNLKSLYQTV